MNVCFLNPGGQNDPFFVLMRSFMIAAAKDLAIELEILDADRSVNKLRNLGRDLVKRSKLPDYLVMTNEDNTAVELLPKATAQGIKVLLINEGLMAADRQTLGFPRQLHTEWLGELLPDDHLAGYQLACALIEAAREKDLRGRDGKIHIEAIGGNFTISSLQRVGGLRKAVALYDDVVIDEVVPGYWEQDRAYREMQRVLEQRSDLGVVWSASDHMAIGAARAAEEAGLKPGQNLLLGGIDWASSALERVADRSFTASVGGHFVEGGWAMILLHDYHHGYDFGSSTLRSQMGLATASDAKELLSTIRDQAWSAVDFKAGSKVHNPAVVDYSFDLTMIRHLIPSGSEAGAYALSH